MGLTAERVVAARPAPVEMRKNLLASVAGNVLFALGSWCVLALLAKLTDAPTVGRYVLALAVTAPIFLFANLQLREVQATDHAERLPFAGYLAARLATSGLAFVACAALSLVFDGSTRLAIVLTAAAKALDAVVDMVYGRWLREERQGLVGLSMALRGVSTAAMVGVALVATRSLAVACVVSLLQSALGLAHAAYLSRKNPALVGWSSSGGAESRAVPWRQLLPFVPLGLAVALDSLAVNVPRYLIQGQMGAAGVGAFGAVCTFMQFGCATVVVGLTQVGVPRLARHYAADDREGFARLLLRLLGAGLGCGAAGLLASALFGKAALAFAFGPAYAAHDGVLRWTMLAAIAWYASGILACAVTAAREFRVQLPVFGAATACVALSGLFLVPRYGLEGAAVSILLGFLLRALTYGVLVVRLLGRLDA